MSHGLSTLTDTSGVVIFTRCFFADFFYMLFPLNTRPAAMAYQARVRTKPDLDSVLLPIGSGGELSRKHEQGPRP
jgi:hypothetical protein